MHKKTAPQSVFPWSWWLNSHVLLLPTLQSVPQGPDVLTAVLLLWQSNTCGFVSAASGENPQDLVPSLLSSCSFCPVQNELPAFEPLQHQNSRFGHSQETHLRNLLLFLQIQNLIYGISEGAGAVAQRAFPSAFPGASRYIWSPEILPTLEHFSLICHHFQWAFLKTRISYTQCKSTSWFQSKYLSKY